MEYLSVDKQNDRSVYKRRHLIHHQSAHLITCSRVQARISGYDVIKILPLHNFCFLGGKQAAAITRVSN